MDFGPAWKGQVARVDQKYDSIERTGSLELILNAWILEALDITKPDESR